MKSCACALFTMIIFGAIGRADEPVEPLLVNLPVTIVVRSTNAATAAQTKAIGERLGGAIERLTNSEVAIFGKPLRVNVIAAADEQSSAAIYQSLRKIKGDAFCLRKDRQIIEYVAKDLDESLARVASFELGFVPKPEVALYRVTAEIATIDEAEYNACNPLFLAFLANAGNSTAETKANIEKLSKSMKFGRQLIVRDLHNYVRDGKHTFEPPPETAKEGEGLVAYNFAAPPQREGVSYVTATFDLAVAASGISPDSQAPADNLTEATEFWPADNDKMQQLAAKISRGAKSDAEKVAAILSWLTPGKNLKYAGDAGSRHGVLKVLEQKFGRCWDFSDVFITLCRAEGIPCRQVAGWLYGVSGHVWAEYYLAGKGWQQVDPTGGNQLACGIYHIPYFTSNDGRMPIVYLSMPKIEWIETP